MKIKEVTLPDLAAALALVNRVFYRFVAADYGPGGRKTFEDYLKHKAEDNAARIGAGEKRIWGAYENDAIVGVISLAGQDHISLLFVEPKLHRRGIATRLFRFLQGFLDGQEYSGEITVNSSPYAVPVYQRLGFEATGELQENDGIKYVPMVYKGATRHDVF
ncbi:MAG: GNAT family N-acetyltransferase [Bacillota bacterium]|nr:GNAT family N-acetyltransferase [Bacillota bacterium]